VLLYEKNSTAKSIKMTAAKPISKKKSGTSTKKSGISSSLIFSFLAIGIALLATQVEDPTPLTAVFRRWRVDREIVKNAEAMGGHVYSYDPLVIYLPNFLNKSEIAYLAGMGCVLLYMSAGYHIV